MDKEKPAYAERIVKACELVGLVPSQLARELGISQQAADYLFKKAAGSSHTTKIASLTGTSANWLGSGIGRMVEGVTSFEFVSREEEEGSDVARYVIFVAPRNREPETIKTTARTKRYIYKYLYGPGENTFEDQDPVSNLVTCLNAEGVKTVQGTPTHGQTPEPGDLTVYNELGPAVLIECKKITGLPSDSAPHPSLFDLDETSAPYEADPDLIYVDKISGVRLSAGNGSPVYSFETVEGSHAFRRSYLQQKNLRPKDLKIYEVGGLSMVPTLNPGDVVMIDSSQTEVRSGKVYALARDNELLIKRLKKNGDSIEIISDNNAPEYMTETVGPSGVGNVQILGRVVWKGGEI